jgi:hypothetical protein
MNELKQRKNVPVCGEKLKYDLNAIKKKNHFSGLYEFLTFF